MGAYRSIQKPDRHLAQAWLESARAATGRVPDFGMDQEKGAFACRSLAEVKSLGSTTQNPLLSDARPWPAASIPGTRPSQELATVASAGAVWLLISLKVHAKKTATEGLEFVA